MLQYGFLIYVIHYSVSVNKHLTVLYVYSQFSQWRYNEAYKIKSQQINRIGDAQCNDWMGK